MFITFEGIDGSGKTTQINLLEEQLIRQNYRVEVFREPGGTDISEQIRTLLLDTEFDIRPVTELLLFSAARAQLVSEKISPLLKQNVIVILDRYYDSTLAYQGYGRQVLSEMEISKINNIATQNLTPDITFYLKVSLAEARKRTELLIDDRMERSGETFYQKVIEGFDTLARREKRIKTIDTSKSVEYSQKQIWDIIKSHI